jgi:hypothetical protein
VSSTWHTILLSLAYFATLSRAAFLAAACVPTAFAAVLS